jgi:hypothetical protein
MELASPESIHALVGEIEHPKRVPLLRRTPDAVQRLSKGRGMRCTCGQCRQCLDDARWERIFDEKFADPEYYTRRTTHISSPLTSL